MKRLIVLALLASACTPSDWKTVETVASDVVKIAQVLCLADHAQHMHKDAMSVAGLCDTAEKLAPYMPAAQHPGLTKWEAAQ